MNEDFKIQRPLKSKYRLVIRVSHGEDLNDDEIYAQLRSAHASSVAARWHLRYLHTPIIRSRVNYIAFFKPSVCDRCSVLENTDSFKSVYVRTDKTNTCQRIDTKLILQTRFNFSEHDLRYVLRVTKCRRGEKIGKFTF